MDDKRSLTVTTSDFLATGDKGLFGVLGLPAEAIVLDDKDTIRDAMAQVLRERGGTLDVADKALFDPDNPRIAYPGKRPLKCPAVNRQ